MQARYIQESPFDLTKIIAFLRLKNFVLINRQVLYLTTNSILTNLVVTILYLKRLIAKSRLFLKVLSPSIYYLHVLTENHFFKTFPKLAKSLTRW